MCTNDNLEKAIQEFEKVVFSDICIELKTGKFIKIRILPEQFFHLLGIHKLSDLNIRGRSKKSFYNQVKKGKIKFSDIKKSVFYDDIKKRIETFTILDVINEKNLIEFNKHRIHGCNLNAKYLFYSKKHDLILLLGISNDSHDKEIFVPSTFFPRIRRNQNQNDKYVAGQTKLQISKISIVPFKNKKSP